jgi:hypothetical protein
MQAQILIVLFHLREHTRVQYHFVQENSGNAMKMINDDIVRSLYSSGRNICGCSISFIAAPRT